MLSARALLWPCRAHAPDQSLHRALQCRLMSAMDGLRRKLMRLLRSPALTLSINGLTRAAACAESERSLGMYKVYYWLTVTLFVLMFVMAAWFVALVAVNTTGGDASP